MRGTYDMGPFKLHHYATDPIEPYFKFLLYKIFRRIAIYYYIACYILEYGI